MSVARVCCCLYIPSSLSQSYVFGSLSIGSCFFKNVSLRHLRWGGRVRWGYSSQLLKRSRALLHQPLDILKQKSKRTDQVYQTLVLVTTSKENLATWKLVNSASFPLVLRHLQMPVLGQEFTEKWCTSSLSRPQPNPQHSACSYKVMGESPSRLMSREFVRDFPSG